MNKEYCLTGTKIVIRRLFKQDMEDIAGCYEEYKKLYYNPINAEFLENVFLQGEIWGAYLGNSIIGCCYYFPLNSSFFAHTAFYSALADFISRTDSCYLMGYIGIKYDKVSRAENDSCPTENGLYQAFFNIAQMQAFRRGLKYVVHASPVKLGRCPEVMFCSGYTLVKLRGLENLVVHQIFAKAVFSEENIYGTDSAAEPERIPADDTKKVSALLENGYCGVDYSKKDNLLLFRRLIAD